MKKIEFYPASKLAESVVPPPRPASEFIPEWYKDMKVFGGDRPIFKNGSISNKTAKSCMPFFDSLASGYIQETWTDIQFSFNSDLGTFEYHYATTPEPVGHRENSSIRVSSFFRPHEFTWKTQWVPKLEKGYSMIVTHPLNRLDLPFMNTAGIIDSDVFFHSNPGNYPFYVYKNFEGIIPKGTPMYQMIPIKRDDWYSVKNIFDEEESLKRSFLSKSTFIGNYKKFFHKKKTYR